MREQPRKGAATIPVLHFSKMPASLSEERKDVYTRCPPWLEGDNTAFAFHMMEDSYARFIPKGTLMFATRRRDPVPVDFVLFEMKDGHPIVRFIAEVKDFEYKTTRVVPSGQGYRTKDESISFDKISSVAIISGTCRI